MLHVTNGDSTVPELSRALGGAPVIPWRDALHEGPVPDVPDDELRELRARFLGAPPELLRERDEALAAAEEVTLWFEADLYDQLQIVQILARLTLPPERVRLACIGEHPGIARFGGLGELYAEQLAALEPAPLTRRRLRARDAPPGPPSARPSRAASPPSPPPARPSCASSARRSTGSAASTPRRATGCR